MVNQIIVADIGGTHSRFAVTSAELAMSDNIKLSHKATFLNKDYGSLYAIINKYRETIGSFEVSGACIASAGFVIRGQLLADNIPWNVHIDDLQDAVGSGDFHLINDFEAAAYGCRTLAPADYMALNSSPFEAPSGPIAVIGPGTGLGSALILTGDKGSILSTEAGQMAFAPSNQTEFEILEILQREYGYVSIERVLSGAGLLNLYRALSEMEGEKAVYGTPEAVSTAALDGDVIAREALMTFCAVLGSVAGDLVMAYGARGGLYLAGGILPQIKDFLTESSFLKRFVSKGTMQAYLEDVPVRLVTREDLGLIGAAASYLTR